MASLIYTSFFEDLARGARLHHPHHVAARALSAAFRGRPWPA